MESLLYHYEVDHPSEIMTANLVMMQWRLHFMMVYESSFIFGWASAEQPTNKLSFRGLRQIIPEGWPTFPWRNSTPKLSYTHYSSELTNTWHALCINARDVQTYTLKLNLCPTWVPLTKFKFVIPRPALEKFKNFPSCRGSILWDNLTSHIQHSQDYDTFKHRVPKTPNFERYPVYG